MNRSHHSPLTTHHSPLTTHHSPLTTHHSPLTTHHSRLTTHDFTPFPLFAFPLTPVEPKPPAPRCVGAIAATSTSRACATRCTTSWAMRSPRAIANGSWPRLASRTCTSPR